MRNATFLCALALIFLRFSVLPETIEYFTGIHTYLLYIFAPPALIGVFAFGGLKRAFRQDAAKFWLAYVLWMVLAVPFSTWKGDSLSLVLVYLRTDLIMFLVAAGLAVSWAECQLMIYVIAAAAVVNLATARLLMNEATYGGRFGLESNGMISDPNDLAAHLLLVLPCILFVALSPRVSTVIRTLLGGAVIYGFFLVLRSGSRGGFIALMLTCALAIIFASRRQRLVVAVAGPAILLALIAVLPRETWNRLKSISGDSEAAERTDAAAASREARIYLLKKSVEFTLMNPVFGVGPGQFQNFEGIQAIAEGHAGVWRATHNTYTQISSECGIPALIFFLGAIISTFKSLWRIRKRAFAIRKKEISTAATCLLIAFSGYTAASFFLANGYRFQFLAFSGLVVAIDRVLAKYLAAQRSKETPEPALIPVEGAEPQPLNA